MLKLEWGPFILKLEWGPFILKLEWGAFYGNNCYNETNESVDIFFKLYVYYSTDIGFYSQ